MPESSFLPEEYLQKRAEQRSVILCVVLLVIVVGGLVGVHMKLMQLESEEIAQSEVVNQQYAQAVLRIEQLDDLKANREEMHRKASIVAQLIQRLPRSRVVAELVNHMPASMSWDELDLKTRFIAVPRARTELEAAKARQAKGEHAELSPEPAPRQEIQLVLVGVTNTDVKVAQFMSALQRSELFEDLNLKYSQEAVVNDQMMRRFRIDLKVNTEIDPAGQEPTLVGRARLGQDPMGLDVQIGEEGLIRNTFGTQSNAETAGAMRLE